MTPATERISLTVNGRVRELEAPPARTLLDVLREDLYLTGAKLACDDGECGSCFVLLGKKPTKACLLTANRCQGKEITTIEGLNGHDRAGLDGGSSATGALHPLQEAFLEAGATQCGFCIPGMIMKAEALLMSGLSRIHGLAVLSHQAFHVRQYPPQRRATDETLHHAVGDVRWQRSNGGGC